MIKKDNEIVIEGVDIIKLIKEAINYAEKHPDLEENKFFLERGFMAISEFTDLVNSCDGIYAKTEKDGVIKMTPIYFTIRE